MTGKPGTALAAILLLAVGGCSGSLSSLVAKFETPSRPVDNELPAAEPMDAARSRTLFLIIVEQLHKSGRSRAALAYITDYERIYPGDPRAMLLDADCLVSIARYKEADPLYQKLLRGDSAAEAQAGLGRIAAAAGDWKAAATRFQEASRLSNANPDYLNDLGYAQTAAGTYDQALVSLRQAYELADGNRTIRNNLILALHLSGKEAEARTMLDRISQPEDRRDAAGLLHMRVAGLPPNPDAGDTLARLVPVRTP